MPSAPAQRQNTSTRSAVDLPVGPALLQGAAGGLAAGMVFAGMTMWLMQATGVPAKLPLLAIATILQGEDNMGTASPLLGAGIHMVLSMAFGAVFVFAVRRLRPRTESAVVALGLGYGVLLYLVNFIALGSAVFDVFTRLNQPFQVLNHAVYGVIVGLAVAFAADRRTRSSDAPGH